MSLVTYGWITPCGNWGDGMGFSEALLFVNTAIEEGRNCRMVRYLDGELDSEWRPKL